MKFCQPSASQSKSTQTRPSSLGSRKTCEPLDPCCFRFSRLVVEKTLHQRSKSSTFVVAKNNSLLLCGKCRRAPTACVRARVWGRTGLVNARQPYVHAGVRGRREQADRRSSGSTSRTVCVTAQ